MSHDPSAKLVMMANQIGKFFASQREEIRVPGIAEHITLYSSTEFKKTRTRFFTPEMAEWERIHLGSRGTGEAAP